jgi:SAM-dependent methyltransferase
MPSPIDFGDLRRLVPIDANFGGGRGQPIDRHYIERFLAQHATDVRGRVLEVAEDHYTHRYGGPAVTASEVLHRDASNPRASFIGDLAEGGFLPDAHFDCFICTQTLQYVYALDRAVATVHRMLRPGGVWLLTVPGISQISPYDRDRWGEHWRFTPQSVARLLGEAFNQVEVQAHGNVLAATGFLQGLAAEDLSPEELNHVDDRYPMLITARAVLQA